MSNFTQKEIEYLKSQRLGRLATVNEAGEPHVVPVGYRYNAQLDTIDIGGANMSKSRKFRDATQQGHVAFVVDDVLPPWVPRGVEIRGRAETIVAAGQQTFAGGFPEIIRIHPSRIVGWGLDTDAYRPYNRSVSKAQA